MLLDFEKLMEPYSGSGCTLDLMLRWLSEQGRSLGFDENAINMAMIETFTAIKKGVNYLGACDCGCSLNNVHTRLNHHLLRRCQEIGEELQRIQRLALEERTNTLILHHIQADNEAYIAETCPNGPPKPKEAEAKWAKVLAEKERELQKQELLLLIRQHKLRAQVSEFHRSQQEGRIRTPRWKIWKRSK